MRVYSYGRYREPADAILLEYINLINVDGRGTMLPGGGTEEEWLAAIRKRPWLAVMLAHRGRLWHLGVGYNPDALE